MPLPPSTTTLKGLMISGSISAQAASRNSPATSTSSAEPRADGSEGLDDPRVDQPPARPADPAGDVALRGRAARGGVRLAEALLDQAPDVLDAAVPGEGERAPLDHLHPGVLLGVV